MPIIKSAKKRVRVAEKAAIRNSKTKRTLKVALKAFRSTFTADDQSKAQSAIDTAAKKGLIHKNKAARQKAQLARAAKAAGADAPAKKSTAAKKAKSPMAAPAKKTTAAKKATTAKVAPAKAAAKKTTKK